MSRNKNSVKGLVKSLAKENSEVQKFAAPGPQYISVCKSSDGTEKGRIQLDQCYRFTFFLEKRHTLCVAETFGFFENPSFLDF